MTYIGIPEHLLKIWNRCGVIPQSEKHGIKRKKNPEKCVFLKMTRRDHIFPVWK
jgi:hypothetical protein